MANINPNEVLASDIISALREADLITDDSEQNLKQKMTVGRVTAADWQAALRESVQTAKATTDETAKAGN